MSIKPSFYVVKYNHKVIITDNWDFIKTIKQDNPKNFYFKGFVKFIESYRYASSFAKKSDIEFNMINPENKNILDIVSEISDDIQKNLLVVKELKENFKHPNIKSELKVLIQYPNGKYYLHNITSDDIIIVDKNNKNDIIKLQEKLMNKEEL